MNLSIIKQIVILRRKSLIALAVFFIATLALQLFLNFYQIPRLEKLRAAWSQQAEIDGRGAALQSRETLYKNGLVDLAKFRERIYLKSNFARFISELYDLAAKNNLELTSITYKPLLNTEEQLLDYKLAVAVSGKYPQLKRFIYDLGSASNILVIDSISLASTDTSADTVQLQIQITSYFRKEGQ